MPLLLDGKLNKITPPAYFFLILLAGAALHLAAPLSRFFYPPFNYAGIVFILSGFYLAVWADRFFHRNNTSVKPGGKPSSFIKEGPYKFSRNPMYLGMLILLCGIAILLGSAVVFISPAAFYIVVEAVFIPEEEKSMEEAFGPDYIEYKKKVRKWL